eukprot:INCI11306.1.p1 GENE.INCI11306.1~~INCI11306.1.p1  ORF type:complete len:830 (-),score=177.04 INCI11306.1:108-2597(-)
MSGRESRDFKASVQPLAGEVPTVKIVCVPEISTKLPPITINDPSSRRILSVGLSKLEATFTKVYWKQNLASKEDRQRIVKINGYSIEIYKKKGGKPVKVLNTRDVINVYDPSINPRCRKRQSALDIIAFEPQEKQTRYLITLQMEKSPSVAAYACREMFTGLQTAIQHGFLDVVITKHTEGDGEDETETIANQYVILRPPNLHFYDSFDSLKESRQPICLKDLDSINAPSEIPEAIVQFDDAVAATAFDLVFGTHTTLTLAASNRQETRDEDLVHSRTLADILCSWDSTVPRALVSSDFRFTRYFLTKEREVGFGFVLGLRKQALPTDREPYFWETKPMIRVVMLSKYKNGVLGPSGRAGIRLNDVIIAINGDTKIRTITDCARHLKGSLEAFVDVLRLPLHENVISDDWENFGDEGLKQIYIPPPVIEDPEHDGHQTPDEEEGETEGETPNKVADAVATSVRQSMAWRRASLMAEGEIPLPMMAGGSDPTAVIVDVGEGQFLGLKLAWNEQLNFPVVESFVCDELGEPGTVEAGGMVAEGMVLGTINGGMTFNTNLDAVLKKLEETPRPLHLEFMPLQEPYELDTVEEEDEEVDEMEPLEGIDGPEESGGGADAISVLEIDEADLPTVNDESLAHVKNLNLDEDMDDPVSPDFHQAMLKVVETEGTQYLAIRNGLVASLSRSLAENEKNHIKRYLGRLELQRINELEQERQRALDEAAAAAGGGGAAGGKKRGGRKKPRQLPPRTKPPGMSPEEWRRMLSNIENNVSIGPAGEHEMYNKTMSGRYKRVVVDLAEVAGQKFAAGLISQEQYDSILDDLGSGKVVEGDVF